MARRNAIREGKRGQHGSGFLPFVLFFVLFLFFILTFLLGLSEGRKKGCSRRTNDSEEVLPDMDRLENELFFYLVEHTTTDLLRKKWPLKQIGNQQRKAFRVPREQEPWIICLHVFFGRLFAHEQIAKWRRTAYQVNQADTQDKEPRDQLHNMQHKKSPVGDTYGPLAGWLVDKRK